MSRSWWLKTALLLFLVLASVILLTPTVVEMVLYPEVVSNSSEETAVNAPRNPPLPGWYEALPDLLKNKTIALGLDLQGGLMMTYSVDLDSAIDEKLASNAGAIQAAIISTTQKAVRYTIDRANNKIIFKFDKPEDKAVMTKKFLRNFEMLEKIGEGDDTVTLGVSRSYMTDAETAQIQKAVEIVRERIDGLGVAQPSVRVENKTQIVVELPGLSKAGVAQAERLISTTAVLTFKLIASKEDALAVFTAFSKQNPEEFGISVHTGTLYATDQYDPVKGILIKSGKDILRDFAIAHEDLVMNAREVVYEKLEAEEDDDADAKNGTQDVGRNTPATWRMVLVRTDLPIVSGDHVERAAPATNQNTGMPEVSLKLNGPGGDRFYELSKFVGERLAILMDDTLISDPVFKTEIAGGNVAITMGSRNREKVLEDVNNLVVSLNAGALPAPIRQESKTLVGPSLGRDSIESGMKSLSIGFGAVVAFMILYYKGSGLVASFALLFNILFILAGMASMGAVLTLPGIAGIVLTVGMAVDSNVIVFERIREELRIGETVRKSIIVGFDKALWTILDSNITTAIAAVVLMNFGSGPVKGFAVTLLLGIIATVYTAFYVTRNVFELKSHFNHDSLSI